MEKNNINSGEKISMVENILDSMRYKILTQKYTKNYMLTEAALSEEYNTSRGSIRAALQALENEGLITTLPNGRKQVKEITEKYIKDLYEVRRMLECKVIEIVLAKKSISYTILASAAEDFNTIESDDDEIIRLERIKVNTKFHRALFELSENRPLLQCWTTMEPIFETFAKFNSSTIGTKEQHKDFYVSNHIKIFELIVARDKSVKDYLIRHINDAEEETLRDLKFK
jgi:DNA-binding GntR family transcriptional regulator